MNSDNKFPVQPTLLFQGGDASPEEIQQWMDEQDSYEEVVHNVLTTVILGGIFQAFTFGMMILAFYITDVGLRNA